jgi:peptide-methionine (S)-S-oxide reductase
VGYAGGTTPSPTYQSIGDHAETIEIDFDPEVISYRELLDVFWSSHNPTGRKRNRQYMSAVFAHDDEQLRLAQETARALGDGVTTEIVPFSGFTLAEAYHQKYRLRQLGTVVREYEAIYPDLDAFVRSTATTRVNAFLAGADTRDEFEALAHELGLSEAALDDLRRSVR